MTAIILQRITYLQQVQWRSILAGNSNTWYKRNHTICKRFTRYPCNLCGETIFSVLLLPARKERHRTRCKYVIRCNMMAVIIRVFYDHGMNFPLKAPTRAYYLVTRYHVNGKATRLYKTRYLDDC